MNTKIANALSIYFETLYEMNRRFIVTCGKCEKDSSLNSYKMVLDIIQDIPKIIPFSYDKSQKRLSLNDRNGLLEFKEQIDFLENDYKCILNDHYSFLDKIRKIRNKTEHKMHAVKNSIYSSDLSNSFYYGFYVEDNNGQVITLSVDAKEFIHLLQDMNIMFSKLQNSVKTFAIASNKTDYPYYWKLCRFDFMDFNRIYESTLFEIIGKIFVDF